MSCARGLRGWTERRERSLPGIQLLSEVRCVWQRTSDAKYSKIAVEFGAPIILKAVGCLWGAQIRALWGNIGLSWKGSDAFCDGRRRGWCGRRPHHI